MTFVPCGVSLVRVLILLDQIQPVTPLNLNPSLEQCGHDPMTSARWTHFSPQRKAVASLASLAMVEQCGSAVNMGWPGSPRLMLASSLHTRRGEEGATSGPVWVGVMERKAGEGSSVHGKMTCQRDQPGATRMGGLEIIGCRPPV
jgi:hypothetical protein